MVHPALCVNSVQLLTPIDGHLGSWIRVSVRGGEVRKVDPQHKAFI